MRNKYVDHLNLARARVQSLETETTRLKEELSATTEDLHKFQCASLATETRLKGLLARAKEDLDTSKAECSSLRDALKVAEEKVAAANKDAEKSDQDLTATLEKVDQLEADLAKRADEVAFLKGEVEKLVVEKESAESDLESLKVESFKSNAEASNEVSRLNARVAELEASLARARFDGATAFKNSAVFQDLVGEIVVPVANRAWDICIDQAKRVGAFKPDFDPENMLDMAKDGYFRNYADEEIPEPSPDDEFFGLRYTDADADLVPAGRPEGDPEPPNYPPKP